ncbi:MAG TPA: amidohydrolase family protein [Actinomycetes bacterium]|nr:amidohydrolase family protein [Actinomycetes bacterium]
MRGETIAVVASPGALDDADAGVVDASGMVVVPGGIEPHAHQDMYIAQHPELDYYSLGPEDDTVGMVHGGVTTHLDFCFVHAGEDLHEELQRRCQRWDGRSHTDYGFHIGLLGPQPLDVFDQVPELVQDGFPSFKAFTVNTRKSFRLDYGRIALLLGQLAAEGGILAVHAEDEDTVQCNYEQSLRDDRMAGWNIHEVRSHLAEELAFQQTVAVARAKEAAVYFVHASTRQAVEVLADSRGRGLPVYGETLHHYLCRTAEEYRSPRGFCYHTYPSLKTADDQEALWQAAASGVLSTVATDEMPTSLEVKLRGERIDNLTGGNLGAEARMGVMYSEGVVKRGMRLERFVELTSSNAARIFGLYPTKGVIAPGSDADLAIIDPELRMTLTREDFHVSDYSPWEGWEVVGWPVTTILRGRVLVRDRKATGVQASGRLVRRRISRRILEGPGC